MTSIRILPSLKPLSHAISTSLLQDEVQKTLAGCGFIMLALQSGLTYAQTTPPDDNTASTVIVTGTRQIGMKAADSPSPIQIIDASVLEGTGQPDLIGALAQVMPSFNAQATGADTSNLTLSARLRGVSPNDTLVLIDGKRRHTTANLSVDTGTFQGSAAADLNFIPIAAIDHIEVLTDGAAAQYGTDAIAGVINIILKKDASGGSFSTTGGRYIDGGGRTADASVNAGFELSEDGFMNLTGESKYHGFSQRSGPDPRALDPATLAAQPAMLDVAGFPYLNHVFGDAAYHLDILSLNSGYKIDGNTNVYAFATVGKKDAQSYENYRTPSKFPIYYPAGFSPLETLNENDFALTVGVKGKIWSDWNWDLSSTYGKDINHIGVINSVNIDLYDATGSSPTSFNAGNFIASQWTQNLDLSREFNVGWYSPLNLAAGLEYRTDTYQIDEGDAASTYGSGAQAFPGFTATDAGHHSRNNSAAYADLAGSPIKELELDAAARFEKYSDFGDTTVGKLTGRYDFNPAIALRSTISTGFRAPTLAEEYYSSTNVTPQSAFVQLPPNSVGATLIGIDGLKPEKSKNYSIGLVIKPTIKSSLTIDAYQIDIRNRIVGSGNLYGTGGSINSPAVNAAIAANGNTLDLSTLTFSGVNVFTNAVSTSTKGLDVLYTIATGLGDLGRVDWSVSGAYNTTEVTQIDQVAQQIQPQTLLNPTAISNLTVSAPKFVVNFGALWKTGSWAVNLREDLYGPSSEMDTEDGSVYYQTTIHTKVITDLDIANHLTKSLTVSIGATNLFNQYPPQVNPGLLAEAKSYLDTATAVRVMPSFSPFGINGGFYYAKMTYTF